MLLAMRLLTSLSVLGATDALEKGEQRGALVVGQVAEHPVLGLGDDAGQALRSLAALAGEGHQLTAPVTGVFDTGDEVAGFEGADGVGDVAGVECCGSTEIGLAQLLGASKR